MKIWMKDVLSQTRYQVLIDRPYQTDLSEIAQKIDEQMKGKTEFYFPFLQGWLDPHKDLASLPLLDQDEVWMINITG